MPADSLHSYEQYVEDAYIDFLKEKNRPTEARAPSVPRACLYNVHFFAYCKLYISCLFLM